MLERRSFHVVFVSEGHGVGVEPSPQADVTAAYDGTPLTVAPR